MFLGHLPGHPVPVHPGIVDQDLEAAESLYGRLHSGGGILEGSDVAFDRQGLAAQTTDFFGVLLGFLFVLAVGQAYVGTFTGQILCNGRPDSLGSPGNDRIFSFEKHGDLLRG